MSSMATNIVQFQTQSYYSSSTIKFHSNIPSKFISFPSPSSAITNTHIPSFQSSVVGSTFFRCSITPHYPIILSSSSSSSLMTSFDEFKPFQLFDVSDFHHIASPDGLISISGFGSLLSERSARSTFPDLINFRVGRLKGFRRVFGNVAPVFFERGIAKPETKEISSLCVEPCEGEELIVTVFEIQKSEVPSFIEREIEFRFLAVLPETLDGKPFTNPAVLCARSTDEEFFNVRCKGSKEVYHHHYGRYNIDKIWRDDILPCRVYLRHCVLAAKNLGDEVYNNFLDHTYLGDRKTALREYLATTGSGIMEEEPPESLKSRYGG